MQDDLSAMADGVSIHSGFPNPAAERRGQGSKLALDLNQLLVKRPSSTYLFRIAGHGHADQGVYDGDVAVIDRSLDAGEVDLVLAWRGYGFVICRRHNLQPGDQFWGVITSVIHQYK